MTGWVNPWTVPVPSGVTPGGSGIVPAVPGAAGGGGAPAAVVRTVPPVSVEMPPGATPFAPGGERSLSSSAYTTITGASFDVPAGSVGFVKGVTLQVQNVTPTSAIYWTLRVNHNPAPGLSGVYILPANIPVWNQGWTVTVVVPSGRNVDVQFSVQDGATYTVAAQLFGWYVPAAMAQASARVWGMT